MTVFETPSLALTGREAFGNLLKTVYGPLWQLHVHTKVVIWSLISKPKGRIGGKAVLNAVVTKIPQSAGISLPEYYNLPAPDSLSAVQPETHTKDLYLQLQWTGQVERAAQGGDKMAWARPAFYEMQLARQQFMLNVARKAYVGYYDILSHVNGAVSATTLTVDGRDTRTSAAASWFNFGTHYLRVGMLLSGTDASDPDSDPLDDTALGASATAGITSVKITAIDADNNQATLSNNPAVDFPDNGFVYPLNSRRDPTTPWTGVADSSKASYFATFNGLGNLITDTNLYSEIYTQTRGTSLPTFDGKRLVDANAQNRPWSEMYVTLGLDRISDEGTGREPNRLVCHRSVRREVVKENRQLRQSPMIQTESGFGRLMFQSGDNMLPYIVDRDCMPGLVWMLDTGLFGWLTNSNMGPLGSGADRFVANKDAHAMNMHMSGQEITTAPYCHGAVEDVNYSITSLNL